MTLTFDREELKRILAIAEAATEHAPIFEQLYDPELRKDGREPDLSEDVSNDDIDQSKLKPGLLLVTDHGIFFASNHAAEKRDPKDHVYAHEANPDTVPFEKWWKLHTKMYGGDDGVEYLSADHIRPWLESSDEPTARLKVRKDKFDFA